MGDNAEPSSNAAQGAQPEDDSKQGLLTRWFGAFSGQGNLDEAETPSTMVPVGDGPTGGLANLTRLRVEDVMVPKVEIVAVPSDISKAKLVEVFRESGLTRLPVFKDTLDTPQGMVHLKDFALRHGFNGSGKDFSLATMMRPLLYAPPSMPISSATSVPADGGWPIYSSDSRRRRIPNSGNDSVGSWRRSADEPSQATTMLSWFEPSRSLRRGYGTEIPVGLVLPISIPRSLGWSPSCSRET